MNCIETLKSKANLTEAERAYQELLIELGPLTEEQSTKLKTLTSEAALNKAFEDAAKKQMLNLMKRFNKGQP